jgi:hypothetical protein
MFRHSFEKQSSASILILRARKKHSLALDPSCIVRCVLKICYLYFLYARHVLEAYFQQAIREKVHYAAPAWHHSFSAANNKRLERLQKRALRAIGPILSFAYFTMAERRQVARDTLFERLRVGGSALVPGAMPILRPMRACCKRAAEPLAEEWVRTKRYQQLFVPTQTRTHNRRPMVHRK